MDHFRGLKQDHLLEHQKQMGPLHFSLLFAVRLPLAFQDPVEGEKGSAVRKQEWENWPFAQDSSLRDKEIVGWM